MATELKKKHPEVTSWKDIPYLIQQEEIKSIIHFMHRKQISDHTIDNKVI